ncbi:hypothetical protein M9Y10_021776 [Tritrichomonas musculus]|uniref:Uncharacterized protein n=1 Tax=Tritrichomonas musculus TaxID=1915356 RepID=A0ABR2KQM2_9EUKA
MSFPVMFYSYIIDISWIIRFTIIDFPCFCNMEFIDALPSSNNIFASFNFCDFNRFAKFFSLSEVSPGKCFKRPKYASVERLIGISHPGRNKM